MKGVLVGLVAVLALAAPAAANTPTSVQMERQIVALQKQVAALQAQMAALKQHDATLDDRVTCEHALAGDTTNFVWHQVMGLFAAVFSTGVPADLPRFDDQGACARTGVTRTR